MDGPNWTTNILADVSRGLLRFRGGVCCSPPSYVRPGAVDAFSHSQYFAADEALAGPGQIGRDGVDHLHPGRGAFWSLIELGFMPGTLGPNKYGEDPLAPQDT